MVQESVLVSDILELEALPERVEHVDEAKAAQHIDDGRGYGQATQEAQVAAERKHVGRQAAYFVEELAAITTEEVALLATVCP